MSTINAYDLWDVAKQKGLYILTGESCAYSMRILCDVSPECQSILSEFLGEVEFKAKAWNHNDTYKSVMLTRQSITDFSIFILLHTYACVALIDIDNSQYYRCYDSIQERDNDKLLLNNPIMHQWFGNTQSRNQHQFTSRYT